MDIDELKKKLVATINELPPQAALNYLQSCENHGGDIARIASELRATVEARLNYSI